MRLSSLLILAFFAIGTRAQTYCTDVGQGTWTEWTTSGACTTCQAAGTPADGVYRIRLCTPPQSQTCIYNNYVCDGDASEYTACPTVAAPLETTTPLQTTTPLKTTTPSETTTSLETTILLETTTPLQTTTPLETTTPSETTTPLETTILLETTTPLETTLPPTCGEWSPWACNCCGGCLTSRCTRACLPPSFPCEGPLECLGSSVKEDPTSSCISQSQACNFPLSICCQNRIRYVNITGRAVWCKEI